MLENWLESLAGLIGTGTAPALVFSFVAGVLTSFTPCSLSSIPLIIGFVGGTGEKNTKRAFAYSAVFAAGSSVTFVTLGVIAALAGKLIGTFSSVWYILLGVIMILMAFQTYGIYNFIPSSYLVSKNKKTGVVGAFLSGILSGIFSSPCSTPVLVALLAVVVGRGSLIFGIILMILYSVGYSTLTLIAGTSVGFAQKLKSGNKYRLVSNIFNILLGTAILLIGLYMFWLAF